MTKAYQNLTEMQADIWFGGQLDKVLATLKLERGRALDEEMKRLFAAKKEKKHYFPYGEPDCLFCGVFGPADVESTSCTGLNDDLTTMFGQEVTKAMEYFGNGADDDRWVPGQTAVESLIRENKELMADQQELVAVRLAISKGLGVERGHSAALVEGLYGRIEELTNILKERTDELSQLHRANHERRSRQCPHGYDFHAECPECYLTMTAEPVK